MTLAGKLLRPPMPDIDMVAHHVAGWAWGSILTS